MPTKSQVEPTDTKPKYPYEQESLKKRWDRHWASFAWHTNHLNEDKKFEYDRTILEKKNFIITPNSIERIRKKSYYISRGVPVLLAGHSGTSKIFDRIFMSCC